MTPPTTRAPLAVLKTRTSSSHFLQKTMKAAQVAKARARMRTRVRRNLRPELKCLEKDPIWWNWTFQRHVALHWVVPGYWENSLDPPIVGFGGELFLFCSLLADSNLLLCTPRTLLEEKYQVWVRRDIGRYLIERDVVLFCVPIHPPHPAFYITSKNIQSSPHFTVPLMRLNVCQMVSLKEHF